MFYCEKLINKTTELLHLVKGSMQPVELIFLSFSLITKQIIIIHNVRLKLKFLSSNVIITVIIFILFTKRHRLINFFLNHPVHPYRG